MQSLIHAVGKITVTDKNQVYIAFDVLRIIFGYLMLTCSECGSRRSTQSCLGKLSGNLVPMAKGSLPTSADLHTVHRLEAETTFVPLLWRFVDAF